MQWYYLIGGLADMDANVLTSSFVDRTMSTSLELNHVRDVEEPLTMKTKDWVLKLRAESLNS